MKNKIYPNKIYSWIIAVLLLLYNTNISAENNSIDDPATTVSQILGKLETFSHSNGATNTEQLRIYIKTNILSQFALKEMSEWITGPYSQRMSAIEKNKIQQQLEKSLSSIISSNIGSFKTIKSRVQVLSTRYKTDESVIVSTRIKLYNNVLAHLELHMLNIKSDWKIIDVKANGSSALIYYRQHFMPQLRMYAHNREDN